MSNRSIFVAVLFLAVAFGGPNSIGAQDRFSEYDLIMLERPSFPFGASTRAFPSGLKELWLKALARPDAELQRMIIDSLAIAHRRGMEGLTETQPRLLELLLQPDQRLDVICAVVQTLIVFDARDQAETLAAMSLKHGLPVAQLVEPALARWKSPIMQEVWLERVTDSNSGTAMITLAMQGLGELKSEQAVEPLEQVLRNSAKSSQLRMSAARALGKIRSSGLVDLAQSLIDLPSRPSELHSLLAIELLTRHEDSSAVELLTALVSSQSTAVQSRSLERLYEIDINLVDQHAETLVSSGDANVRRWCALAMIAKQDVGRIKLLCSLLDDVNPSLRRHVSSSLVKLAELPGFRDEVLEQTTVIVDRSDWRGCEQAVVVLTKLDHKPSGKRMVELLGHERGDVQVAAAWGLTKLRIEELLPDMLEHAQSVYEGFKSGQLLDTMPGASLHVAHLFNAFGDQRYRPADPLMRNYVPKNFSLGDEARPAAVWALGLIYEDDLQEDLATALEERLNDTGPLGEEMEVRRMSAVGLGRMNAESALPSLRRHASNEDSAGKACYWAVEQLTGESPPPPPDGVWEYSDWFLMPRRSED